MELIIKPTGRCNFNCTFCSSANLDIAHPKKVQESIKDLIEKMKPNGIIVTGGEPLTIGPDYYWELLEISKCNIGLTSNMKDFYLNPSKWESLFRDPRVGIITSFNYGDSRRWDKNTPYTEEKFKDVFNMYLDVTGGRRLQFIAVIDKENEHLAIDHVYLAKDMNTKVKLNGASKLGLQGTNYPRYKMMQLYMKIIELGLSSYELSCCERDRGMCAFNTSLLCQSTIRCCYVDSNDQLHYGVCDDEISMGIEIEMDEFPIKPNPVLPKFPEHVNKNCVSCELFRLCHGCVSQRKHLKEVPEHCIEMKKMKDQIINSGWLI